MKTLYKTIKATYEEDLDKEVNKYLEQGWQLYGNPYTTGWRRIYEDISYYWEIEYYQAIIKKYRDK